MISGIQRFRTNNGTVSNCKVYIDCSYKDIQPGICIEATQQALNILIDNPLCTLNGGELGITLLGINRKVLTN